MGLDQYDVVLVNLDPTVGSEIRKTRPCLIISPNEINVNLRTITVAPLTTTDKNYPTSVKIRFKNKMGFTVIDQVRTIDKSRVVKVLGRIKPSEIKDCKAVIRETFVD